MKKIIIGCFAGSILFTSCKSSTLITSEPPGARLYLNDEFVGVTPYQHTDRKVSGSKNSVKLEKEGYESTVSMFKRNERVKGGAIVGGIFFFPTFLWIMGYKKTHTYELPAKSSGGDIPKSIKSEKLKELKNLYEQKLITLEEYEANKKKILEE